MAENISISTFELKSAVNADKQGLQMGRYLAITDTNMDREISSGEIGGPFPIKYGKGKEHDIFDVVKTAAGVDPETNKMNNEQVRYISTAMAEYDRIILERLILTEQQKKIKY